MDYTVVVFPRHRVPSLQARTKPYKLLAVDKIDICRWEAEGGAPGVSRIAIHEGDGACEGDADVALLYAPGVEWARWGVARRGGSILLWQCRDGQDLGLFDTMREALNAAAFGAPDSCPQSASLHHLIS